MKITSKSRTFITLIFELATFNGLLRKTIRVPFGDPHAKLVINDKVDFDFKVWGDSPDVDRFPKEAVITKMEYVTTDDSRDHTFKIHLFPVEDL